MKDQYAVVRKLPSQGDQESPQLIVMQMLEDIETYSDINLWEEIIQEEEKQLKKLENSVKEDAGMT